MENRRSGLHAAVRIFLLLISIGWLSGNSSAQTTCRDDILASDGFSIRSLEVKGRWVPSLKELGLDQFIGAKFSPQVVSTAQSKVSELILNEESRALETNLIGAISGLHITSCVSADEALKVVDITIRPRYIRLDIRRLGNNTLPIPRTLAATFYKHVPKPLLTLNPLGTAEYDRKYGFSPGGRITTDLLQLNNILSGKNLSESKHRLDFQAGGKKSLGEKFYDIDASLRFSRDTSVQLMEEFSVGAEYLTKLTPRGEGDVRENLVRIGGGAEIRIGVGSLETLNLKANYRHSRIDFNRSDGSFGEQHSENAVEARASLDGKLANGFARFAVWIDAVSPSENIGSYGRAVAKLGFHKEFGKGHQTVGVEVLLGAGSSWGRVPEYVRYFGGNSGSTFLYEDPRSLLTDIPDGPLIRSFGKAQLKPQATDVTSIRGGTSFFSSSVNLTIPLPKLSRPLVPDIIVDLPSGAQIPLRRQLVNVTNNTALSTLAVQFEKQGLSPEEAEERARKIVDNEIRPVMNFVANKANLFSLKPMVMLDAASLRSPETRGERTRIGLGGGLQLTIVVAKFEIGYMSTIRKISGDPKGNFIFRLAFMNLF
ncbi:MAG TPA: hypothetical protein PKD24_10385 [Pyrinomonadaceae bacterium]|nr:hypothetical protein [Pyrinomonadaceae bacterium]HMP65589.1 hypothetical protein [Pyrinomonadaceae bacterium]